jgi:hypothetical protein
MLNERKRNLALSPEKFSKNLRVTMSSPRAWILLLGMILWISLVKNYWTWGFLSYSAILK